MNFRERLMSRVVFEGENGAGAGTAGANAAAGAGAGASAAAGGAAAGAGAGAAAGASDAGAAGGDAAPWYKPFNLEQKQVDYLNAKGAKNFGDVLKIAQDFEGVARQRTDAFIPKPDPAKLNEWAGWEMLGWNKDPTKYTPAKPKVGEGQIFDETMFKGFVEDAHGLQLPADRVGALFEKSFGRMQARIAEAATAQKTEQDNQAKALDGALRSKWGANYDANGTLAKRALKALGVDDKKADQLEKIIGAPALVEMFHTIGSKLPEDTLNEGFQQQGGLTPEQARSQRLALEAKPEWMAIFNDQRHPQNTEYVAERQRLIRLESQKRAA